MTTALLRRLSHRPLLGRCLARPAGRLIAVSVAAFLAAAFSAAPAATADDRPNVLLLCVDDLRPELGCYDKSYIDSPNIDSLAAAGCLFQRHYVQAPTCGASRYAMLTGCYGPASNRALFQRAERLQSSPQSVTPSMPAFFRDAGYRTVSIGKVSHHPGGRGGSNWNDDAQPEMPRSWDRHLMPVGDWQHPRGAMHGLAHGEIRKNAKDMDVYQSVAGGDSIYPDGLTTAKAIEVMGELDRDEAPFFLAVGIIRPHLPFGAPAKYMTPYADAELPPIPHPDRPEGKTTWHRSGEFMKYNRWNRDPNRDAEFADAVRRHYAACVSYADAQVGRLLQTLKRSGQADNTIIVLWGDHGWHLGEHAIWGKHALFEESLRSPLIIVRPGRSGGGKQTSAIVESIDIFPTLCELAGLNRPDFVDGVSLRPLLDDPSAGGHPAVSYRPNAATIRTDRHRLIEHRDGHLELYDHGTAAGETKNLADAEPDLAASLRDTLQQRLSSAR